MIPNPKFAYFGTSDFAVDVLKILKANGYIPSLIISTPNKKTGRKGLVTPPPVISFVQADKTFAETQIIQPEKLSKLEKTEEDAFKKDFDLFIVVDYGNIIPQNILDIPKHGSLNVHVSLLPNYRGASPMQTALLDGVKETGVTIMEVVHGLDEGRIVATETIDLTSWKPTFLELAKRSAELGGNLLVKSIPNWISGANKLVAQDETKATYSKKFKTEDGFIDSRVIIGNSSLEESEQAERRIRALNPNPGTWTLLPTESGEVRIKILSAKIVGGKLVPVRIVPAGKKEMAWEDFLRGNRI